MLKPLEQWYCDKCGEVIASARDGSIEWLVEDDVADAFRVVHRAGASPRYPGGDCYFHTAHRGRHERQLDGCVGPAGLPYLLSFLDLGPVHDPNEERTMRVRSVREFVEIMRRLTLPYYEEARTLWGLATEDGFFDAGGNEIWVYSPDTLKTLIERYSGD
jgi:hypothetical protein